MQSKRIAIVDKEDFRIDLEYNSQFWVFHLPYVAKFTKGVFGSIKLAVEDFTELAKTSGHECTYAAIPEDDNKMERLVGMLGFQYLGEADNLKIYRKD